jgi:ClpP class serine protease
MGDYAGALCIRFDIGEAPEEGADIGEYITAEASLILSEGRWTHDYPITVEEARRIGLPISTDMPRLVYALMDLYPQPAQRRPSVDYVPLPYERPPVPALPASRPDKG